MTTETRIAEPREFTAVSVKGVVWLAVGFGLLKFVLSTLGQVTIQHAGYGIFRDELYFIVCGRHLASGYVDQPPVIPLVAAHFRICCLACNRWPCSGPLPRWRAPRRLR